MGVCSTGYVTGSINHSLSNPRATLSFNLTLHPAAALPPPTHTDTAQAALKSWTTSCGSAKAAADRSACELPACEWDKAKTALQACRKACAPTTVNAAKAAHSAVKECVDTWLHAQHAVVRQHTASKSDKAEEVEEKVGGVDAPVGTTPPVARSSPASSDTVSSTVSGTDSGTGSEASSGTGSTGKPTNPTKPETPPTGDVARHACVSFGFGAMMIKTKGTCELVPENGCTMPIRMMGGGKKMYKGKTCAVAIKLHDAERRPLVPLVPPVVACPAFKCTAPPVGCARGSSVGTPIKDGCGRCPTCLDDLTKTPTMVRAA